MTSNQRCRLGAIVSSPGFDPIPCAFAEAIPLSKVINLLQRFEEMREYLNSQYFKHAGRQTSSESGPVPVIDHLLSHFCHRL